MGAVMNSPAERPPSYQIEGYNTAAAELFADIVTRPVGNNIDEYAERAFQDLVDLVQDVQATYDMQPTIPATSPDGSRTIEDERRALAYFGLDPYAVESVLAHLERISNLDGIIADITEHIPRVIVPPAHRQQPLVPGGEKPYIKQHIPRLKTFLSALGANFGIDLRDRDQCRVIEGQVDPDMMREESYKLVLLPSLQRAVLICDEAENVTFVFDSSVLATHEGAPTPNQLIDMTKDQLRELIETVPGIGYRLVYSGDRFVGQISALMDEIPAAANTGQAADELIVEAADEQLLAETAATEEDGAIIGTPKLATALGATRRAVRQAIEELGETLGPLAQGDRRGSARFSVAQQGMIRDHLAAKNKLAVPEAPDDFMSFTEMCRVFGAGESAVRRAIADCGDGFGDALDARRGARRTNYYSPDQQLQVLDKLIEHGSVPPRARPGYAPITQIAEGNNLTVETLTGILAESENFAVVGEPETMRFGSNTTGGYSPAQQEEIAGILEARGLLRTMQPGDVNAKALSTHFPRHSERQVKLARDALDGTAGFGTWHLALNETGNTRARVYSAGQVDTLEAWLNTNYPEGKTVR
jgi:hypothetical protein